MISRNRSDGRYKIVIPSIPDRISSTDGNIIALNVLFVCLGNICRSPMAAGITRRIFLERGISGEIESAGTADWNVGSSADQRAIDLCRDRGLDISGHRARQVRMDDFERFDLIVVMDRQNERELKLAAPASVHCKIRRLMEFTSSGADEIPDPYHSDRQAFTSAFDAIEGACEAMVDIFD